MSVMTTDGAPDVLLVEFELARLDLAAATAALRHKDTPAARGEVANCRARIDRILDSGTPASGSRCDPAVVISDSDGFPEDSWGAVGAHGGRQIPSGRRPL